MATMTLTHRSKILGKDSRIELILPDALPPDKNLKVLYLLHGMKEDATAWETYSSLGRYVRNRPVLVVMPDAFESFYTDMKYGLKYFTYIAKEIPEMIDAFFPVSSRREDRFIAGLSMGGYGALKIAFSNPSYYGAAASFSGAVDIEALYFSRQNEFAPIFGITDDISEHSLFQLAKQVDIAAQKPFVYQSCGTEDFMYALNIKFRDYMKELSLPYEYKEFPGGHEWELWDKELLYMLDLFGI